MTRMGKRIRDVNMRASRTRVTTKMLDHPYETVSHTHRKVTRAALVLLSGLLDIGGLSSLPK